MSNILKCDSCGGSNQLPEGKTSMFCAFCGNAIEKPLSNTPSISNLLKKPKVDFKTNHYLDLNVYLRTDLGSMSLKSKGLSNFKQITDWFTDKELEQIGYLVLEGNKFSNLEGIELFSNLRGIDLSNNNLKEFKYKNLPKDLAYLKLSGNDLTSLPIEFINFRASSVIWIENNPSLNLQNLKPQEFNISQASKLLENGKLEFYSDNSGSYEQIAKQMVSPMPSNYNYKQSLYHTNIFIDGMKEMYRYKFKVFVNNLNGNEVDLNGFEFKKLNKEGTIELTLLNKPLETKEILDSIENLIPREAYHIAFMNTVGYNYPDEAQIINQANGMFNKIKKELGVSVKMEKTNIGNNNDRTDISKDSNFNFFDNYSQTQTILAIVHLISPLLLLLFIGNSLKDVAESFFGQLAIACLIIGIIFALITGGRTKQVKTGYSFKTKSGARFDEYEDKEIPGIPISSLHAGIGLIHFAIPIIVFLFWIASKT